MKRVLIVLPCTLKARIISVSETLNLIDNIHLHQISLSETGFPSEDCFSFFQKTLMNIVVNCV